MARTTPRAGRRPRGSFGQWTTGDQQGAVRDHAGWDAAALAVIDGGGCLLHPGHDTDPSDPDAGVRTTRRPARRTTTTRKGGRR